MELVMNSVTDYENLGKKENENPCKKLQQRFFLLVLHLLE